MNLNPTNPNYSPLYDQNSPLFDGICHFVGWLMWVQVGFSGFDHLLDGGQDKTNPFAAMRGDKMMMHSFAVLLWTLIIIRSTLQSRPNKCPSTKSYFNFNEIWLIGRGWWVMHDSMQYDPIQGQGHEPFKKLSPLPFTIGAGNWPWILKLGHNI